MSTLNVENIKHIAADSDSLRLATDGTVTFTKNVTAVTVDSATITNLSSTNVTADSATITNLSGTNVTGTNVTADSATITNLSGTNMTASGDIKGSSFNGGQLGGRRNLIINGAMQVAQRGTSIACPASTLTYTMDRFFAQPAGNSATTVSQVTDAPVGFQYSARVTRNSGQTGTLTRFETPFETRDIVNLREKKVTVSFYAKAGSNLSTSSNTISLLLFEGNGTERARGAAGYDNQTLLINSPKTLTTSWQRFTHTTSNAISSDTTQLAVQFQALWTGTAGSNDEFFITGIQLEAGETATPFEHRSYGEELALCQRYYFKKSGMLLYANSTRTANVDRSVFFWPVTMRAAPASGDVSLTFSAGGGTEIKEGITDTSCTFGQNNPSATPVLSAIEASAEL